MGTANEDLVQIHYKLPDEAEEALEAFEGQVDADLEGLAFSLTIGTGRTVKEIFTAAHDPTETVASLPRGVSVQGSVHMAAHLLSGLAAVTEMSAFDLPAAIASATQHVSLTYKKEELNAALAEFDDVPSPSKSAQTIQALWTHMLPDAVTTPAKGLEDVSEGVKSLVLRAQCGAQMTLTFKNFQLGPLFKTLSGEQFDAEKRVLHGAGEGHHGAADRHHGSEDRED